MDRGGPNYRGSPQTRFGGRLFKWGTFQVWCSFHPGVLDFFIVKIGPKVGITFSSFLIRENFHPVCRGGGRGP